MRSYLPKRTVKAPTAPEVAANLILLTRQEYAVRRLRARVKPIVWGDFHSCCTRLGVAAHKTRVASSRSVHWVSVFLRFEQASPYAYTAPVPRAHASLAVDKTT